MLAQNDIIYFIVTDRFFSGNPGNNDDVDRSNPQAYHGGDFAGIIDKIPYLKKLGVTVVWITPVYQNIHLPEEGRYGYHGYWPLDFEKVDPHLYTPVPDLAPGSKLYLRQLSDALHAAGMKLMLDMVVNHTGYNHPGLKGGSTTPIKPEWFNAESLQGLEKGRLAGLPDLNQDNPETADYSVNVILDWIEDAGIDCIRMDTARHVESDFWYRFKTYVKGKYPQVSVLGEVLDFNIDAISEFQRHFAFDSLFDFPTQRALTDVLLHGAPCTLLAGDGVGGAPGIMDQDSHYTNHNRLVTLLDNHDLPARIMTSSLDACGGDRAAALGRVKAALTMLFTVRGIPQLYYGTELCLEGGADPDNRRDMPWELVDPFTDEPRPEHKEANELYTHVQRLALLRTTYQALCYGSMITLYADATHYAFLREFRGEAAVVLLHTGAEEGALNLDLNAHGQLPSRVRRVLEGAVLKNRLDPEMADVMVVGGNLPWLCRPHSCDVFTV